MKKGLFLLVILVIASVTGTVNAVKLVSGQQESVEIEQQVISGDPLAAEGWQIRTGSSCDGKLSWETVFPARDGAAAESEFVFRARGERIDRIAVWEEGVYLGSPSGFGMGGSISLEGVEYQEIFEQIAERTPAGETREETITLADYYEYYPLRLEIRGGEYVFYMNEWDTDSQVYQALQQALRIPVHPEEKLVLAVGKNEQGVITDIGCNSAEGFLDTRTSGIFREDGCYFTCTPVYWNGEREEPIRGAENVIYHMPIRINENREVSGYDRIEVVIPLPADCKAQHLAEDEAGNLLLLSEQGGKLVLTVYENGTWQQLQQLELLPMGAEDYFDRMTIAEEGTLISMGDGAFCFLTRSQEDYKITIRGSLALENDKHAALIHYSDFAYDGENLAVVGCPYRFLDANNSVYLGIYSQAGTEYVGFYGHSGDIDWKFGGIISMNCSHDEGDDGLRVVQVMEQGTGR